ncbi:MAG TPA: ATP-binding cassette domain-containing protein, partial [Bacteroidia bacterium]|nr:ATP-binding cassette domain-containing protein [Bacteroidia bacterium]
VGLMQPDSGEIALFGTPISHLNTRELNLLRKKVGFLFQSGALYDSMTVRENLEFPLRDIKSMRKEEKEKLVVEALTNVGLQDAIDKMPNELSGGMRKRVGLARTLILYREAEIQDFLVLSWNRTMRHFEIETLLFSLISSILLYLSEI